MTTFIALVILVLYSFYIEPRRFYFRKARLQSRKKLARPISFLHVSDLHFTARNTLKENFLKQANAETPDFIFVTGDIIDNNEGIEPVVDALAALRSRAGIFAVLGNHDYWDYHFLDNFRYHLRFSKIPSKKNDVPRFVKALEQRGIVVLRDSWKALELDGMKIVIGGTEDPVTQSVNLKQACAGFHEGAVNILLTHLLDCITMLPNGLPIDIAFSGHTHGGQIRIPGFGGLIFDSKLPRQLSDGIHSFRGIHTCVSRGLGAGRTLTPRFFCRPEVACIQYSD